MAAQNQILCGIDRHAEQRYLDDVVCGQGSMTSVHCQGIPMDIPTIHQSDLEFGGHLFHPNFEMGIMIYDSNH
jgi:hypothetical protein